MSKKKILTVAFFVIFIFLTFLSLSEHGRKTVRAIFNIPSHTDETVQRLRMTREEAQKWEEQMRRELKEKGLPKSIREAKSSNIQNLVRGTCRELPIALRMGGSIFSLPTRGYPVSNQDGLKIDVIERCDLGVIENVSYFRWGDIGFKYDKSGKRETSYAREKHLVNKFKYSEQRLGNGTLKYLTTNKRGVKNSELYILPTHLTSDANNAPILFRCSGDEGGRSFVGVCNTLYHYKKNITISYKIFRSKYSEDEFLRAVQDKHKVIESILKN